MPALIIIGFLIIQVFVVALVINFTVAVLIIHSLINLFIMLHFAIILIQVVFLYLPCLTNIITFFQIPRFIISFLIPFIEVFTHLLSSLTN